MSEAEKVRFCNVAYLNCTPYRAAQSLSWIEYSETNPADAARRLREDECDLACIPLAELAGLGRYSILDFGISAIGAVDSVSLFAKQPLEHLEEIYLDPASRTSVALLKLLLDGRLGRQLQYTQLAPEEALPRVEGFRGALAIGDAALCARGEFPYVYDLSQLWHEDTGLPFVFALWAGKPGCLSDARRDELRAALFEGVGCREVYARQWADEHDYSREAAAHYVTHRIIYSVGAAEMRGAEEFIGRAANQRLFPFSALGDFRGAVKGLPCQTRVNGTTGVSLAASRGLDEVLEAASSGLRLSFADGLYLAQQASLADLALAADSVRQGMYADGEVSYIVDRNINYTNVCNVYCRFCAFYRAPGKDGGYVLSKEEIGRKIQETVDAGGVQILLQGGLNPELGIEYYEDLFRWMTSNYPVKLHALSSDEVWHISRVSSLSLEETLRRLIEAGMNSLPGGGAEILVDRVRRRIARLKTTSEEWLDVHRVAHRLGITSTATMMFGVQETWQDRIEHFYKLRALQDETGGFTAFISWPFQSENTKLKPGDTSSVEYLRVQALSRLMLDNIPSIQNSWVTQGPSVGQIGLFFGANDFGSVMFEENVVSSAGTTYCMDAKAIERHINEAGFSPWQRDVHYRRLS